MPRIQTPIDHDIETQETVMKCEPRTADAVKTRADVQKPNGHARERSGANGVDRRIAHGKAVAPGALEASVLRKMQKRASHLQFGGAKPSPTEQERILGTNDLVDEFYLERALAAAKPVCRITTRNESRRVTGYATGFMVSPSLLLTNWHVLKTADAAAASTIEFDYTFAIDGSLVPSVEFTLQPTRFFAANEQLDCALVAVAQTSVDGRVPLARYGYHRLIAEADKIEKDEWITIIQHPGGRRRQYAIRENNLKDITPQQLHYVSDTAPGSSGAPAFNDSFQVVALHHQGHPKMANGRYVLRDGSRVTSIDDIDESAVVWESNEGIRVSVLCDYFRTRLPSQHALVRELHASMTGNGDIVTRALRDGSNGGHPGAESSSASPIGPASTSVTAPCAVGTDIPLTLHITLGSAPQPVTVAPVTSTVAPAPVAAGQESSLFEKAVQPEIDTSYEHRTGYDPKFLSVEVPLPKPKDMDVVSKLEDNSYVIPYEHFSIVMNKKRRLALFCASNVDGRETSRKPDPDADYSRKGLTGLGTHDIEEWVTDPRIPEQHQLPDRFYSKDRKAFDRGHLVRREDMAWGEDLEQVRRANNDTYHTTNCSPQVAGFNQSAKHGTWGQLENEILKQARNQGDIYTLLAGPVLAEDDHWFEGKDDRGDVRIQIPRRFWKVVITAAGTRLKAFGFVLEQSLKDVKFNEEFQVSEAMEPHLCPLSDLQDMLGLTFPKKILDADQYDTASGEEIVRTTGVSRRARKPGAAGGHAHRGRGARSAATPAR